MSTKNVTFLLAIFGIIFLLGQSSCEKPTAIDVTPPDRLTVFTGEREANLGVIRMDIAPPVIQKVSYMIVPNENMSLNFIDGMKLEMVGNHATTAEQEIAPEEYVFSFEDLNFETKGVFEARLFGQISDLWKTVKIEDDVKFSLFLNEVVDGEGRLIVDSNNPLKIGDFTVVSQYVNLVKASIPTNVFVYSGDSVLLKSLTFSPPVVSANLAEVSIGSEYSEVYPEYIRYISLDICENEKCTGIDTHAPFIYCGYENEDGCQYWMVNWWINDTGITMNIGKEYTLKFYLKIDETFQNYAEIQFFSRVEFSSTVFDNWEEGPRWMSVEYLTDYYQAMRSNYLMINYYEDSYFCHDSNHDGNADSCSINGNMRIPCAPGLELPSKCFSPF